MLSINSSKPQKCTPNLLPARLGYNGPVTDTERYWQPAKDEKEKSHAYFRGRHLHGTTLPLPSNYTGAVLHVTDKTLPQTQSRTGDDQMGEDDEEDAEMKVDVKVADKVGEFEEIVVWGHGGEVDGKQDAFVKGMEEWIGFAEAIHSHEDDEMQRKRIDAA